MVWTSAVYVTQVSYQSAHHLEEEQRVTLQLCIYCICIYSAERHRPALFLQIMQFKYSMMLSALDTMCATCVLTPAYP